MKQAFGQLVAFHKAMQQPIGDPAAPDATVQMDLRVRLIAEEFGELLQALAPGVEPPPLVQLIEHWLAEVERLKAAAAACVLEEPNGAVLRRAVTPNLPAVLDALGDIGYVNTGAAVTWGLPLPEAWDEIHRANMQKSTGEVRPDGKRLKPPGFRPPDIAAVIRGAQLGISKLVTKRQQLRHWCSEAGDRRDGSALDRYEAEIDVLDMKLRRLGFDPDGLPQSADEPELTYDRVYKQVVESVRQRHERGELASIAADDLVEHLFTAENLDHEDEEDQPRMTREMLYAVLDELKLLPEED